MEGEPLYALAGHVFHDAALGGEPQGAIVLDDAQNVLTGHVEGDASEVAVALVVGAESGKGAHPEGSLLVEEAAVHLVVGQSVAVRVVLTAEDAELACLAVVAPQTFALG